MRPLVHIVGALRTLGRIGGPRPQWVSFGSTLTLVMPGVGVRVRARVPPACDGPGTARVCLVSEAPSALAAVLTLLCDRDVGVCEAAIHAACIAAQAPLVPPDAWWWYERGDRGGMLAAW